MLTDWSVNTPASSLPQEGFSGLIERITFHSEETGFAVLRVKVKGHPELMTVVGVLASVNAGEWITTQGNWVQDKEHGLQFKATVLKCSPPTSREGIEKYLASGLIKGIGQGQCLAPCKSLVNREKNLFAGHFRGNFLRSRAWRKLCDCPTARNKQYYIKSRYGSWNGPNWRISNNCSMRITIWEASKKWASACTT